MITNNKNSPYNGRVHLEEPENPLARFQMFERVAVKNKATEYRNPLKGEFEETMLSKVFFSAGNVKILQNGISAGVFKLSKERKLVLPPQNVDVLKTIMRHMFLENATFSKGDNITKEVERLNDIVLDYTVPKVFSETIGYLKYLEDQSRLVVPMSHPQQSDRMYKQLELKPFM